MKNFEQLKFALLAVLLASGTAGPVSAQTSNAPPEVSIVWPREDCFYSRFFQYISCIKIKAVADDPDGTIAQVQFFRHEVLIGAVTNRPFEMVWDAAYAGTALLKAVAFDSLGASTESDPVAVTFKERARSVFEIRSPNDGSVFAAPGTFVFSAEQLAVMGCGTGPLEFFAGTNSLGTVTQSGPFTVSTPLYSLSVTNLPEGEYQLSVSRNSSGTESYSPGACQGPVIRVTKLGIRPPRLTPDSRFEFEVVTSFRTNQTVIEGSSNLQNWTAISTNVPFQHVYVHGSFARDQRAALLPRGRAGEPCEMPWVSRPTRRSPPCRSPRLRQCLASSKFQWNRVWSARLPRCLSGLPKRRLGSRRGKPSLPGPLAVYGWSGELVALVVVGLVIAAVIITRLLTTAQLRGSGTSPTQPASVETLIARVTDSPTPPPTTTATETHTPVPTIIERVIVVTATPLPATTTPTPSDTAIPT